MRPVLFRAIRIVAIQIARGARATIMHRLDAEVAALSAQSLEAESVSCNGADECTD
jgi:hypothetical protein